jgi:hypothetical protein
MKCVDISNKLCRLSLVIYILAIVNERPHDEPAYDGLLNRFQALSIQIDHHVPPQFELWSMFVAIPIARCPDYHIGLVPTESLKLTG